MGSTSSPVRQLPSQEETSRAAFAWLLHKVERGKLGLFYVKKQVDECEQILRNMRDLFRVPLSIQ